MLMTSTLPRGILEIRRKNKDGATTVRWRVRIVRMDMQADNIYENFDDAKDFFVTIKIKAGFIDLHIQHNITLFRTFEQSTTRAGQAQYQQQIVVLLHYQEHANN